MTDDRAPALRSADWFGGADLTGFVHRAWMKAEGLVDEDFDGRPIVGIANSWSEVANCNSHLRELAEHVRRGIWKRGGVPLEFPAMSLSEPLMKPTTMLYRNLLAMEIEENLRSLPLDAVVLLAGCDKTTPGMLMGAASADVPAIMVPGGPMLNGRDGREPLGCGEDLSQAWRDRALVEPQMRHDELERSVTRSRGHCQVMGTASTMACMAEALGMTLAGAAAIPAPDARHEVLAERSGARAVDLARARVRPRDVLTEAAFRNAIRVLMAIGGSTNAVVHLVALARRVRVEVTLDWFEAIARETPVLVDLRPSGTGMMEDFFEAGGVPAVVRRLAARMEPAASVRPDGEAADGEVRDDTVVRPLDRPIFPSSGLVVLRGNLCPDGAIIKQSAASPSLLHHVGRAVVFRDRQDVTDRIDDPALDIDETSVIILQRAGPRGGPGMPEWGRIPIPRKLAERGVTDLVRISDGRMSGTGYGTCVVHVSPESAVGGPLALVRDGDLVELDVPNRRLDVRLSPDELAARRAAWTPDAPRFERDTGVSTSSTSSRRPRARTSTSSRVGPGRTCGPTCRRGSDRRDGARAGPYPRTPAR